MKLYLIAALAALGMSLSGCATVFEGTSQDINVVTNPPGASCVFTRQGTAIGTIPSTPGILNVPKRKYDLLITCSKPGYADAQYLNHSGTTATIAANVAADFQEFLTPTQIKAIKTLFADEFQQFGYQTF